MKHPAYCPTRQLLSNSLTVPTVSLCPTSLLSLCPTRPNPPSTYAHYPTLRIVPLKYIHITFVPLHKGLCAHSSVA